MVKELKPKIKRRKRKPTKRQLDIKERARRLKQKRYILKFIKERHLRKTVDWRKTVWCPRYTICVSKGACLNRHFITKLKFCVRCKLVEEYYDEIERVIKTDKKEVK